MKNKIMRSLSVLFAVLLAMTLSFTVLADESSAVSDETVSDESVTSVEGSADASEETSEESSEDASAESSKEESVSSEAVAEDNTDAAEEETASDFPWARVITLIVIVALIVAAIVLSKTNTAFGQRIAKFFKEYLSEIKKVSWYSPKDTLKATGVVLVFLIVAAVVIGLLDLGFTRLIWWFADIFNS